MQDFIQQIGIDGRLLLSQAVNFLLLIVILRVFAYKPLIKLLNDRRARIQDGLTKADEADKRLNEVQKTVKEKMHDADTKIVTMFREAETRGKQIEEEILSRAKEKEVVLMQEAERSAQNKQKEAEERAREKSAEFIKAAIQKTVELDPHAIDESLIQKAVAEVAKHNT